MSLCIIGHHIETFANTIITALYMTFVDMGLVKTSMKKVSKSFITAMRR